MTELNFSLYQDQSRTTARYPDAGNNIIYPTLGLCGEAGEVAEKIKKMVRDDGGVLSEKRQQDLALELGDVLWYLAQVATEAKLDFAEIAAANLEKLAGRAARNTLHGDGDQR